jgi:transcriptional regulator with XRE-family HTH domain
MTSQVMGSPRPVGYALAVSALPDGSRFGSLLRSFRAARRLSQLEMALAAGISTRHLSCLETGRAGPSREMVVLLAGVLDLSLRDRNVLLQAAGFVPIYTESDLADPALAAIRSSIEFLLERHAPYPAVLVDRTWTVRLFNAPAIAVLARFVADPALLAGPLNLMRLLFDPAGSRPFIVNWEEVASMMIERLHREAASAAGDDASRGLLNELLAIEGVPSDWRRPRLSVDPSFMVPLRLSRGDCEIALYSAITTLGTPQDVTLQELRLETFLPADAASDRALRSMVEASAPSP